MKRLLRSFRYGELGFTLIELLVVVAILAALAGVVTLAVTRFIGTGEREACLTDEHNVQTAVSAWKAVHRTSTGCPDMDDLTGEGFLLEAPKDRTCTFTPDENTGECTVDCGCGGGG